MTLFRVTNILDKQILQINNKVSLMDNVFMEKLDFREKEATLQLHGAELVEPYDFYRDIFPVGSFERLGHQEDEKPNGIILSIDDDKTSKRKRKGEHRILTDGFEQLSEALEHPFVIMSPISYFGRSRKASNASLLYALTLDIDYVNAVNLEHLLSVRYSTKPGYGAIPEPTYTVNSGHGVHLYYVLEKPVPMYPDNQKELLRLKEFLVDLIWDKYVSYEPGKKECLGLVQGFRMVGSKSKVFNERITAYRTGEKCFLDWLESFDRTGKLKLNIREQSTMSLKEAKEKYPDWYERRVVKKQPANFPDFYFKRDLYDWWKRRATNEIQYGHRYFGIMALAIYAAKCGIEYEELEQDALDLQEEFETRGDELFTIDDMYNALEAYNDSYRTFPRKDIARLTGLEIAPNKRNGRSQTAHLARARAVEAIDYPNGEWRNKDGRPTKEKIVNDWRKANPTGRKTDCQRETGLSRPTIMKWWDS
jgi:hypothetical protein